MVDPAALTQALTRRATPVDERDAAEVLRASWGFEPTALTRLATERDDTFRVELAGGGRALLKIAHPDDVAGTVDAQLAVLADLATHAPHLPVSRVLPARDGAARVEVTTPDGTRLARVLSWLDGEPWSSRPRDADALSALGRVQADLARAVAAAGARLGDAATPARTPWNLLEIDAARATIDGIADDALRAAARAVLDDAATRILPALDSLPRVLAHNDAHGENILVAPPGDEPRDGAATRVTGLLDFGDMTRTPRIADLAVAASYAAGVADPADPRLAESPWAPAAWIARGAAKGWAAAGNPLTEAERSLLAPLILLRVAQRAALNSAVAAASAERAAYAGRNLARLRADLEALAAHPAPIDLGAAP